MTVIWPTSTPILKDKSDVKNWFFGIPISFSAFAKPSPWINPKPNIKTNLHGFILSWTMFSIAVNKIDKAIKGSTILALGMINPDAAKANEKLCASVKMEHWINIVFRLELKKNKVNIKSMWSKPNGITCVKPSWK